MASRSKTYPELHALPQLLHESLYVGIDIGKMRHVAGFVSKTLLERHDRFEACPAFVFAQSREGYVTVAKLMYLCYVIYRYL